MNEKWLVMGVGFGDGGDKNVLKLDCGDDCTTPRRYKTIELSNTMGELYSYMNYMSIKLLLKSSLQTIKLNTKVNF